MKAFKIVVMFFIGMSLMLAGVGYAQQKIPREKISNEFVISDIQPTLSGYQNKATIATEEGDIWIKCENKPNANLVLFVKGLWLVRSLNSEPGSVKYLKSGAIVRFEADGTLIEGRSIQINGTRITRTKGSLIQMSPNTEIAVCVKEGIPNIGLPNCDSPDWFVGSLDYEGSIYSFIGKIKLLGWTLESDPDTPLVFSLQNTKGLVYVSGKGTVYGKNGTKTVFGLDEEKWRVEGKVAALETQPPSEEAIVGAIEKEVLNKFPIQEYCAGLVITSNKLIIGNIKIIEYNKEGQYWKVEAIPKCDLGSVVVMPPTVFSFDFFKVYKDRQGDWKAELIMRNR